MASLIEYNPPWAVMSCEVSRGQGPWAWVLRLLGGVWRNGLNESKAALWIPCQSQTGGQMPANSLDGTHTLHVWRKNTWDLDGGISTHRSTWDFHIKHLSFDCTCCLRRPPYINDEIIDIRKERDRLFRVGQKSGLEEDWMHGSKETDTTYKLCS